MQQLRQTFLTFGLVFESHDVEKMFDRKSEEIETELVHKRRTGIEKITTESVEFASRCGRSSRVEQ